MPTPSAPPRRYQPKPPERSIPITRFPDDHQVMHTEDTEGFWRLTCSCNEFIMVQPGDAPLCTHVGTLTTNRLDSGSIQSFGEDGSNKLDILTYKSILDPTVLVTVNKRPGIVAHVELSDPDGAGFRQVHICRHDKFTTSDRYWVATWPVGLIRQTDGRHAIRQLILEWLMGRVDGCTKVTCDAPQHMKGKAPHENVAANLSSNNLPNMKVLADVFDMLVTGVCRSCNEDDGVPKDDY